MTGKQTMRELETLGTAQNRKVYGRHGVCGPMFGVSFANLEKLKRRIKVDQALAGELWATGNHDARMLAVMVADPAAFTSAALDEWAQDVDNHVLGDAFSGLVAAGRHARAKADRWTKSKSEWAGQVGWNVVGALARQDEALPDAYFEERLATIGKTLHASKNRVRHAMNNALINIGVRNARLRKKAEAVARQVGRVEVDHGDTSCKTPDAVAYIAKTVAHQQQMAARAAARQKSR